jgi:hypothetical protein
MSDTIKIDTLADLTIARLRSHEGRTEWARFKVRGAPRQVRIAAAVSAAAGENTFLRYENLVETMDKVDTRILSGALIPGGFGDTHFMGEPTKGMAR